MTFPGLCERCGGSQLWTLDDDDQAWVKCENDLCVFGQLDLPGFTDEPVCTPHDSDVELVGVEAVVSLEGGAAEVSHRLVEPLQDPPGEFLDTLWEGFDG